MRNVTAPSGSGLVRGVSAAEAALAGTARCSGGRMVWNVKPIAPQWQLPSKMYRSSGVSYSRFRFPDSCLIPPGVWMCAIR